MMHSKNKMFGFIALLGLFLSGCARGATLIEAVTPSPTAAPVWPEPDSTQAACLGLSPQPALVANNRVDAFTLGHAFVAVYQDALADEAFSSGELLTLCQLAANAEASLYNTGDHQIFEYAQQIDQLLRFAVFGDVAAAQSEIVRFARRLP